MTIFALSSGKGRAGVSIIRVSGALTQQVIFTLTGKNEMPSPRQARLDWYRDPKTDVRLDQGLTLYFKAPASFTGEDIAEFHIHGGKAVVSGFLEALGKIEGLRLAEPGEFTRRSFDNGKMDLTEAEGLADLINSETEAQRRQALRQMDGYLSNLYGGWREKILTAMAYLEAGIDFAEEDIPDDVTQNTALIIQDVSREITAHMEDNHRGERLREGLQVVILGEPNIGKSTLLNFLSKRDVAIVSDIAGTTRDILEVHLDLGGFPVTIVDTAGLREANDVIEAEGIRRAEERAEKADLKLFLLDAKDWRNIPERTKKLIDKDTMLLLNKSDLFTDDISCKISYGEAIGVWAISAKHEQGIEEFIVALKSEVEKRMDISDMPCLTRNRHRLNLIKSSAYLEQFLLNDSGEMALLAEDLRMAARSLGKITGQVDVEEILGKIFSEFCIGK